MNQQDANNPSVLEDLTAQENEAIKGSPGGLCVAESASPLPDLEPTREVVGGLGMLLPAVHKARESA